MKKLFRNKKGFTLVELVVVFALTGIMISASAVVMTKFAQTFVQANALSREQAVASTVMESLTSKLGAAKESGATFPSEAPASSDDCALRLTTQGANSAVWFIDQRNYAVKMYVENGYLRFTYYGVSAEDDTDGNGDGMVTTGLGEEAYHNCKITGLSISRMSGGTADKNNCLTVELKMTNEYLGGAHTYTMKRTFACYNLSEKDIQG